MYYELTTGWMVGSIPPGILHFFRAMVYSIVLVIVARPFLRCRVIELSIQTIFEEINRHGWNYCLRVVFMYM